MSIALLFILGIRFILLTLFLFPFVGLAMIPLGIIALIAVLAGVFVSLNRGPQDLPEHPAPGEPESRSPGPGSSAT